MKRNRGCRLGVRLAFAWFAVQGSSAHVQAQVSPRTWITMGSGLLGQASDITLGPDRALYVLDRLSANVVVMSARGVVQRTVGREGSGPGEFKDPTSIQMMSAGGFEVVDRGNNRVQHFDRSGEYLSSRQLPPLGGYYAVAVSPNGHVAVNTLGDTTLIAVYDSAGQLLTRFARAPAAMPGGIDMAAVKREVLEGKVPAFFRNTAEPQFAPDGSVWLALITDGKVERWSPEGTRQASLQLAEPEMKEVREAFFERYRDKNPRGLPGLAFIADLYPTQNACWVLLRVGEDEDAVILRVSNTGTKTGRWVLSGVKDAGLLAVDEDRSAVFLTLSATAEVVEVPLVGSGG